MSNPFQYPLAYNVPIVNKDGSPTDEFMRKWQAQVKINALIKDLSTQAAVSAVLDVLGLASGDLLVRGVTLWQVLPPPQDATQFLNGALMPAFAAVKDSDLSLSDITANNVSTTNHGFAPKLPGDATKVLDGTGAWAAAASGLFTLDGNDIEGEGALILFDLGAF